jgi:uncharacterized membrane protein
MRWLRHLFARSAQAMFPPATMERIATAIDAGERRHTGELCFAVESALPVGALLRKVTARMRAERAFERMRVWDTQANNGVLLYLLLADHRIEIVADRGLHGKVSDEQWRGVCQLMEERLRAGDAGDAVVRAVEAISDLLAQHFPQLPGMVDRDELPNRPRFL